MLSAVSPRAFVHSPLSAPFTKERRRARGCSRASSPLCGPTCSIGSHTMRNESRRVGVLLHIVSKPQRVGTLLHKESCGPIAGSESLGGRTHVLNSQGVRTFPSPSAGPWWRTKGRISMDVAILDQVRGSFQFVFLVRRCVMPRKGWSSRGVSSDPWATSKAVPEQQVAAWWAVACSAVREAADSTAMATWAGHTRHESRRGVRDSTHRCSDWKWPSRHWVTANQQKGDG